MTKDRSTYIVRENRVRGENRAENGPSAVTHRIWLNTMKTRGITLRISISAFTKWLTGCCEKAMLPRKRKGTKYSPIPMLITMKHMTHAFNPALVMTHHVNVITNVSSYLMKYMGRQKKETKVTM